MATPKDEKIELATRAAWLSYIGGMTQQEIAENLNVTRQSSQRLISWARRHGIVSVSIQSSILECVKLENSLRLAFNLKFVRIVPGTGLTDEVKKELICNMATTVIRELVETASPGTVFGFGSGRFLRQTINALPEFNKPDISCVSTVGAIAQDGSCSQYEISSLFANKTNCKRYMLPAPIFAGDKEEHKAFTQTGIYQKIAQVAAQANPIFYGVGQVYLGCQINESGFISDEEISNLKDRKAIGELNGTFFDIDGKRVSSRLDALCTSLPFGDPMTKTMIAISGGSGKAPSLAAAMKAGFINGIITDEETGKEILKFS